ncbi:MAG: excinuclease ABC subunit UvrC [Candidatus Nanopelagicales bacterium]|nr:excinuclease ABC subunit UvrC [Candidatus Nanopelagicales bacterium]
MSEDGAPGDVAGDPAVGEIGQGRHSPAWRPRTGVVPTTPGVYRFRDHEGTVIYVGKARNLRNRLSSYFGDSATQHPRTAAMVRASAGVDWVVVPSEIDALQLEYSWIKEYEPRFNVRFRDDKSYPYIAVTMSEEYPRVFATRAKQRPGIRYFGPYPQGWVIRDTLERLMLRTFPLRTCGAAEFRRQQLLGRPCLLGEIGKCSAPCAGRISAEEHRQIARELCAFLDGRADEVIDKLVAEMKEFAARHEYEEAARLRDEVASLRAALQQSAVVLSNEVIADVFAVSADELQAAVEVFHVRAGRVTGQRGFVVDRSADVDPGELIEQVLVRYYGEADPAAIPAEVLVSEEMVDSAALAGWLARKRGRPVQVRQPRRGKKRQLLEAVAANADQALSRHKLRRGADLVSRGQAMSELQELLDLPAAPLRIECIDISSHGGDDAVASVVVFEDGLPVKSEYRTYVIEHAPDDTAAVRQAVQRRYRDRPGSGPYRPGLLLIDGGLPQVNAAGSVTEAAGIPIRGLAKRLEEVWAPGIDHPVILSRRSEGLYLLQRLRDEAHRVAIGQHRKRRRKKVRESRLDAIPGLGPARRAALIIRFGSLRAIRAASRDELMKTPGVGPALAESIERTLAAETVEPSVDMATGEIFDHA